MMPAKPLPAHYLNHLLRTYIWESQGAAIEPVLANQPTPERATAPVDALSQTLVAPADALYLTPTLPRTSTTGSTTSTSAPADAFSQTLAAPADALPRTSTTSASAPVEALSQTLVASGYALYQIHASPRFDNTSAHSVARTPGEADSDSPPRPTRAPHPTVFASQPGNWHWVPPDITAGSPQHLGRVYNLLDACKGLHDFLRHFDEGIRALDRHRSNYSGTITHLQILWWEFPCERWSELRDGSLEEPHHNAAPNSAIAADQTRIAATFVDELISLGTLLGPFPDGHIKAFGPMFSLEKADQPGQWRILANFKAGGPPVSLFRWILGGHRC
jgi:hypothetical protein